MCPDLAYCVPVLYVINYIKDHSKLPLELGQECTTPNNSDFHVVILPVWCQLVQYLSQTAVPLHILMRFSEYVFGTSPLKWILTPPLITVRYKDRRSLARCGLSMHHPLTIIQKARLSFMGSVIWVSFQHTYTQPFDNGISKGTIIFEWYVL